MKAHIGVDSETGLVHSLGTPPANTADVAMANGLLHGGEERVHGDAGDQEEKRKASVRAKVEHP